MHWLTVSHLAAGKWFAVRSYNCAMTTQHSSTLYDAGDGSGDDTGAQADATWRLLILEDSDDIADILQEVGRAAGYAVHRLPDKKGAAQVCAEYRPAVMLLNLGHATSLYAPPHLSFRRSEGAGLLQSLAAAGSTAQIIIVSGNPASIRQAMLEEGLSLGLNMVAHMGKPFDIDRLEEQLSGLRHP